MTSPEIVLSILNLVHPHPASPADIATHAAALGTPLPSNSSLWASLSRLTAQGKISREGHGMYKAKPSNVESKACS